MRRPVRFGSKQNMLFDLDGTLVDSSPAHALAFRETLNGMAPGASQLFNYEDLKGRSTEEAFLYLGFREPEAIAALTREKQMRYRAAAEAGHIQLFMGAHRVLDSLVSAGKRLFIVSGGSPGSVQWTLEHTCIGGYFEGVIDSSMTARSKPAPEPYLLCLARYSLAPEASLAIEDAENGAVSARDAGIDVAIVHNPDLSRYGPCFESLGAFLEHICSGGEVA